MEEERELQITGAALWNEWEPRDKLLRQTFKLAKEDVCNVWAAT